MLKEVKTKFSKTEVAEDNITTSEAAKFLLENGADGVKVGINPGFNCTSRYNWYH